MVPSEWEHVRLNDITKLITSGSRDWAQYYSDSGSKFVRMTNLAREGIHLKLNDLKYVDITTKSSDGKRTSLQSGDVLMSITAELGKIGWIPDNFGEAYINQHTALIRLDKNQANPQYIAYLLSSKALNHRINKLNDSGAKAGLNLPTIRSIAINIPPLPEQRKIARILTTWDKAIATIEKLILTSRQQKKALMQQLLTGKKRLLNPETSKAFDGDWEEVTLGDVCFINPPKASEPENGLVSFIPMDAVSEDAKLLRKELKQYSEVSKGFTAFIEGDVLVAKITPCFENGKGAQVFALENGIGFGSTEFHVLRAKKNICSQFIYFLTNTSGFRIRGEMNMQGSAGQKRVTTDYLKRYKIIIPNALAEQQKIAQVLTSADKEIEILEAKLAHLKQEKKALMQQLLTGKRRVQVEEA